MDYFAVGALIILLFLLVLQANRRRWDFNFLFLIRDAFILSVIGAVIYYGYLVYSQYLVWFAGGPPSIYLLPPYQSIGYVFSYHFLRFGLGYSISLFCALLFLAVAVRFNKKNAERFFEREEPYLGALAIFLAGTPGELYYFLALILVYLAIHAVLNLLRRFNRHWSSWPAGSELRLPLYWLWLPLAILVIIKAIIF